MELNERNAFIVALNKDFTLATFTTMLLNGLDRRLEDQVNPTGLSFPDILSYVVQRAIQEQWIWNLVEKAIEANPGGIFLKQFVATYPGFDPAKGPPIAIDWVMAHTLRGRRCFIDRKDLRKALKEMRSETGARVLVVTGERFSGKTYTSELITFLSEKTPKHRTVYIDLDKYVFEAPNLTETIGQQMGMDTTNIPKQEDEQKARWVQRMVGWIIARIVNPGDITYWFVFDGFRERTLLPETRDWIEELAVQAETNLPQCRVVLLNYKETLPLQISDYVSREEIKPIGKDELLDFFEHLNRDYQQKYESVHLEGNVETILSQVNAAIAGKPEIEPERLRLLNRAVSETARLLFV